MDTTSEPGSWAAALPFCPNIKVEEYVWTPEAETRSRLRRREFIRMAEPNPHKRGHLTRKLMADIAAREARA